MNKYENLEKYIVSSQEEFVEFCAERLTGILSWVIFEFGELHDFAEPAIKGVVNSHFSSINSCNHFSNFFNHIYTDGENIYDFQELFKEDGNLAVFGKLWEPEFEYKKIKELVIEKLLKLYNLHHTK